MVIGPILTRETRRAARAARTYRSRMWLAGWVLAAIGLNYYWWAYWQLGTHSVMQTAWFTWGTFANLIAIQVVATLFFVPASVARAIAGERDRRTLDDLLMTRLSSVEIILEKLAAGLLHYATYLGTVLPIVAAMPILGGVDPLMVLLAFAGTSSTAFFLAALSILVSTGARSGGQAFRASLGLGTLWILVPFIIESVMPFVQPRLYAWVRPVHVWVMASSPSIFLNSVVRQAWGPRWYLETAAWMIGLQVSVGALMVVWAIVRLRAVVRAQAGGDGKVLGIRTPRPRWRLWPRPACGDDPVLWRELFANGTRGLARLVGMVVYLGLLGLFGFLTYQYVYPLIADRFSANPDPKTFDPIRLRVNQSLRTISSLLEFFLLLSVAGVAAEGVGGERARDTWISLIVTPLEGSAILRAKMLGAIYRLSGWMLLLVAAWGVGVAAGIVHPVGFVAAVLSLGVGAWFYAAMGTYFSLVARDASQASTRALTCALLICATFLLGLMEFRPTMIVAGAGSMPLVTFVALNSDGDVRLAVDRFSMQPPSSDRMAIGELAIRILLTYVIGIAGHAVVALMLTHTAVRRFDAIVGRPQRAVGAQAQHSPEDHGASTHPPDTRPQPPVRSDWRTSALGVAGVSSSRPRIRPQ
jgi:ABC-type transport system involved in multi-copper enzyme maturation permease subunit